MSVRAGAPGGARAPLALVEAAPAAQPPAPALGAFGPTAHRPLHQVLTAGLAAADFPEPAPTEGWEEWKQSAQKGWHKATHGWKTEYKLHVIKAGVVQQGVVAYMKFPAPPKGFFEFMEEQTFQQLEGIGAGTISVKDDERPHAEWIKMVYSNALAQARPFRPEYTCMDIMCAPASLAKKQVFLKYLAERPMHDDWRVMHKTDVEAERLFQWKNFGYFLRTFVRAQHGMNVACYLVANVDGKEWHAP